MAVTEEKLGIKVKGRALIGDNGNYQLMEPATSYGNNLDGEMKALRFEKNCSRINSN